MSEEKNQTDELESLVNQAEAKEAEALSGEWQPSDQPQAEEQAGMTTGDVLAPLLKITFGLMASVKGQHWALDDATAMEAANEYGRCIDHYWPDMNAAPWLGAAITTGMILAPRVMEDNRIAAAKEGAEDEHNKNENTEQQTDREA